MARAQQFGIVRAIAGCSLGLARVERLEGALEQARALVQEALRISRDYGDTGGVAHALVEAALLRSASGLHDPAVRLLAGADAARARLGIVTPGSEAQGIRRVSAAAHDALGADSVQRATSLGLEASLDDLAALV